MNRSIHIPIAEEELKLEVEGKVTGRVRIKTVTQEIVEHATVDLERSDIEVTRVPVNRVVTTAPDVRIEGETTIIPVLEEVVVVEKRLVLKEELHVTRKRGHETVQVPVTLRKQQATVEREATNPEESKES